VRLGTARNRLTRQIGKFSAAVEREMTAASLLDQDRWAVRARFMRLGLAATALAAAVAILMAFLIGEFGAWPMVIPAALAAVAVIAFIFAGAHTLLSNDAVRRAHAWRGFRKYVQLVARDRERIPMESAATDWLPLAVALGVAPAWSAYLKRHRTATPRWFRAVADADSSKAFATLLAIGAPGGGGHGHGGGMGTAAGGGASGAR
jgi:hypothetical protein